MEIVCFDLKHSQDCYCQLKWNTQNVNSATEGVREYLSRQLVIGETYHTK